MDMNSALPIRSEELGSVSTRISDGTVASQQLTVNPDGSVNVTDNGGSLTVDGVDFDIRDLQFATDSVDVSGSEVEIVGDALTALQSIDTKLTAPVEVEATDLDIRDLVAATDSVSAHLKDGAGTSITSTTVGPKQALDVQLKDSAGNPLGESSSSPLVVTMSADTSGDEVNDFDLANNVAGNSTANHTYTVTAGKTFYLTQIECSSSGRAKFEVQVETGVASGTYDTKFVQFNSTANPNTTITLKSPITVAAGVRVRVVKQNRDLLAQDLYSTISGTEE